MLGISIFDYLGPIAAVGGCENERPLWRALSLVGHSLSGGSDIMQLAMSTDSEFQL